MGASLSQPTQHLPGDVLANIKRSKDRDYRFRMALSCHQRFYKHFDPAKLVLNRTEFCAVFAPAYGDPALHFAHLDAHGRGRVSSFEALAGAYLVARNWDDSSEKLLVTALFQVFDRSLIGTLSRVEMEIMLRTCAQALTTLYRCKPVADYVLRAVVRDVFGGKQKTSGGRLSTSHERASLVELLRWFRGPANTTVMGFLSTFDKTDLEGDPRSPAKKRSPSPERDIARARPRGVATPEEDEAPPAVASTPTKKRAPAAVREAPAVPRALAPAPAPVVLAPVVAAAPPEEEAPPAAVGAGVGVVVGVMNSTAVQDGPSPGEIAAEAAAKTDLAWSVVLGAKKGAFDATLQALVEAQAAEEAAALEAAREQDAASAKLQARMRGKNQREAKAKQDKGAAQLQARMRAKAARADLEKKQQGAGKLQAQIRSKQARADLEQKQQGASKLQAKQRSRLARREIEEKHVAATKLQSRERSRLARREMDVKHDSATMLQSAQRARNARRAGPCIGHGRRLYQVMDRGGKKVLGIDEIVECVGNRPECVFFLKGCDNDLLRDLLAAPDLGAKLAERPLATPGFVTADEFDAAIHAWARRPTMAALPEFAEEEEDGPNLETWSLESPVPSVVSVGSYPEADAFPLFGAAPAPAPGAAPAPREPGPDKRAPKKARARKPAPPPAAPAPVVVVVEEPPPPRRELVIDDALAAEIARATDARVARRRAATPPAPLGEDVREAFASQARDELGEDALGQARDAFFGADKDRSSTLDEPEVKAVLGRMGVSAVDELTDYFMTDAGGSQTSRTMDFDDFCIMLAPETAAAAREKRGARRRALSPTRRKFPRQIASRKASHLDYEFLVSDTPPNFADTTLSFASSRTSLPAFGEADVATPRVVVVGAGAPSGGPAPAPEGKKVRDTFLGRMGLRDNLPLPRAATYAGDESSAGTLEEDDASNAGPHPALFKDWQQADLAPEVRAVDDECFAEVSGLRSLSTSLSDLAGGLEELKASMSSFWADKHAKLDEAELGRASAALVVQKHYRRHVVRRRFAQWVDLEDDEDLTSQLEGVRVAVAQFCLANHVDFDRIETKFSTIQDNLDGANRDSVDADRLLGWNPDVPLANLAGSRATACRIREWQSQHRPATREAENAPGAVL